MKIFSHYTELDGKSDIFLKFINNEPEEDKGKITLRRGDNESLHFRTALKNQNLPSFSDKGLNI